MHQQILHTIFILILSTLIGDAIKIGISKPATVSENVTSESIETTMTEPAPTTTTVISTTTRKIETTKPVKTTGTTLTSIASSTTTPLPSTTTTPSPKNDTRPSPIRNQNIDHSGYFCSCDLRHQFCDIDCCCDIDCIPEELNSFDCHREENRLEDFHYQQGLPPCKINEGWLCVFRNNFDDTKQKQLHYVLDPLGFYEWPQLLLETNDLSRDQSYYKIGEPILIYNLEVNEVLELEIPFSLIGQHCQIFESIRHLTSQNTSCHLTMERAQNLEVTLLQKLCTSFLMERPNTRVPLDGIIKDTKTNLIPIILFRCSNQLDCIPTAISNYTFESFEDFDYSSLIQIKIYHNITNLISCDVFFIRSDKKSDKVWQHYEVNFIHINETEGITLNVSGPLGYNNGSPLIIAHKVLLNESADQTNSNLVLNYFHPNRTESIHIHVPRRRRNHCEESHTTLNFGESILVQCSVQLDNATELSGETNFTRICGELHSRTLRFLQGNDILGLREDYFISTLGYPINKTDRWIKIEVKNYEQLPIVGAYLDKEYSFICQNMILDLKYEFLTVSSDVQGVPHQNVLKKATIKVGKRHDLQFQLDETISIPVTFSAVFQDLIEISGTVKRVFCQKTVLTSILILIYFN